MDENKISSITLSELFEYALKVPEYQRPYVWKKDNIDKLLKQFEVYSERKDVSMFYLGAIILHKDDDDAYNIIDGQQRITTLAIIALLKRMGGKYDKIQYENRLSHQNISSNYEYLQSLDLPDIDFNKINVTVVVTTSQDEAYSFFETLNTGGVRLSGTQVIKAFHLKDVTPLEMDEYARKWEGAEDVMDEVVKILLKARKWNILNFEDIPGRKKGFLEWKKDITEEFSEKTEAGTELGSFSTWETKDNGMKRFGSDFALRQPLSNGKNFIDYLLSFIEIYKELFCLDYSHKRSEAYKEFTEKIINYIDGTVDLKAMYELILMCYVSRFGFENLDKASFWIFRYIYSLRVTASRQLKEASVINFNRDENLTDMILNSYSEKEILMWLKKFTYPFNSSYLDGTKGRFIQRVLDTDENPETLQHDYDRELIKKYTS